MSGSSVVNQPSVYGTQGVPAAGNTPGARFGATTWTDKSGGLWLLGGLVNGTPTQGNPQLNDLWNYSAGQWTWVAGSSATQQSGVYGTEGVAAPSNLPGGRAGAVSWIDAQGNLWMFGGEGYDALGRDGWLNDLWRYSGGEWTWMSGSNYGTFSLLGPVYQPVVAGIYGTGGVASPYNHPGAREDASSWIDSAGNMWMFGGMGADSNYQFGDLNDLWKYSGGEWTWMSGSDVANPGNGVYGTQGIAAPANIPGARHGAVTWLDSSGNLCLFGGQGFDANGQYGPLDDMWRYSAGEWTWMAGSSNQSQAGIYGAQGLAASGNLPGGRQLVVGWTDVAGNFWLFGGVGFDSAGTYGDLSDLWKYNGGKWTWVSGATVVQQLGVYGTQGTAATGNLPGARERAASWIDPSGNLWLFGGIGNSLLFNDLWKYQP